MKAATRHQIRIDGHRVEYRVVHSKAARKLRLRVGPSGVEVVQPAGRNAGDVSAFMDRHGAWILDQLDRAARLRGVGRAHERGTGEILFRGEPTRLRIQTAHPRVRRNTIRHSEGEIVISAGYGSSTPIARSLENWFRKQARAEIERELSAISARLRVEPGCLYVMGQRTKWGNCSSTRNLSFNWRLILAPDFVLRYLVIHEAVHLAIPDHSAKFWLSVQSHCREMERAKQWLCSRASDLAVDVAALLATELGPAT